MKKLNSKAQNIHQILFIDIETCALKAKYSDLDENHQVLWCKKESLLKKPVDIDFGTSKEDFYRKRAGIYAEFARVVCISIGYIDFVNRNKAYINTKSFFNLDEQVLLNEFTSFLNEKVNVHDIAFLCGHNIKEFDIPFLCRRLVVNKISIPAIINIGGKKPWQVPFLIDTLEMWKFGDYKNYVSLDLLCFIFNIESSKEQMSGAEVHDYFWNKNDYVSICKYCESDVFTTACVYLRLKQIYFVEDTVHRSKTANASL